MADSKLAADLDSLGSLITNELRQQWLALFSAMPGARVSRDVLMRAIAYRLQEVAHGSRSKALVRRLRGLAEEVSNGSISLVQNASFKPGTKLIREWKGQVHEVVLTNKGYIWTGKHFGSLSEIARAITGTRWSGPRFFGLETGQQMNAAAEARGPRKPSSLVVDEKHG